MNPSKAKIPYPNAREAVLEILNATKGERCIFRGESVVYPKPVSSSLYRQLRREGATPESIPKLLKKRQNELIERIRFFTTGDGSDLERLMASQHYGAKTNFLDFTENIFIALFFACWRDENEDGLVVVKPRGMFCELETEKDVFPDDEIVLLDPPKRLKIARDQNVVLLHAPQGFIPLETGEGIVIKAEWKREILEHLKNEYDISSHTMFGDIQGAIELQKQEYEKRVPKRSQPMAAKPRGVASRGKPQPTIESYTELLSTPKTAHRDNLMNKYAESLIDSFTNALKRNPENIKIYYNRAFVYQSKPTPDYDRALSDYTRAIELDPGLAKTYYNRGTIYCKTSPPDYGKAILDYTRAIELDPKLAEVYDNRGAVYCKKSPPDYEKAILDYTRAIELNPDYARAYTGRGAAYANKPNPDYKRAILDYDLAIALNPNDAETYFNRGTAYATKLYPDYEKAILDYDRALELNPNYAGAHNNRGLTYFTKPNPDYAQAILDYDRALELNPNYVEVYNERGNLYSMKPQPDHTKAISDYDRALELDPYYAQAYNNRGFANYMKPRPDYDKALSDFTQALELDPGLATTYFLRGVVHAKLGDGSKARSDYNEALVKNEKIVDYPIPPELSRVLKSSRQSVQPRGGLMRGVQESS